jgi:2-polyprenyl-6-hydroxyphenyl methylase / 3-demethylubiquinone-9 3-methyltransferase
LSRNARSFDPVSAVTSGQSTIDPAEVARFSALAAEWWNPHGKFGVLHKFNPVRLGFIRDQAAAHFGRDPKGSRPFADLRLLDIGCGGGLLSEPMARLGFEVLGADASEKNIKTASVHAEEQGLAIDYRATTAEALAAAGERFDAILNMEVIEHVADLNLFLTSCASMLKPEGLMFVATINRTAKAFALAIVGAEYVLGWLPRGTHDWAKFVKPLELDTALTRAGLDVTTESGVMFNPLTGQWLLTTDTDVNYMVAAKKR